MRGLQVNAKSIQLQKGKTLESISEELEEPLGNVEQICKVVDKCGLEADAPVGG